MSKFKGSKNKRNPAKYVLPSGVVLADVRTDYNQETLLTFIDSVHGEFVSSFRALFRAKASTHPQAVVARRNSTMLAVHGVENASHSSVIRDKAKATMVERYGVEHAVQNPELLNKARETLKIKYGVDHPMQAASLRQKLKDVFTEKYGVDNPMKDPTVQKKVKKTMMSRYGVENPSQSPELKERYLAGITKNDHFVSAEEQEVHDFIASLGVAGTSGYFGGADPKQVDIKIPDLKIAIEYNGSYWHSECNRSMHRTYHLEKTLVASAAGYKLIHIMDTEWKNRNAQVKSFLRSALGKNERIVYGRKTDIRVVPKKEAQAFLETYHILGSAPHIDALGLYQGDELLCMVTLGRHHRGLNEVVLNRYVGKENVTVIGGLSKLTKAAVQNHGPITTWVDRRYSNGLSWLKCGWEQSSVLPPDYCYFEKKTSKIVSKQSRRKGLVKTPTGMTEHEHALKDGLYRIYDCGKIKLIAS